MKKLTILLMIFFCVSIYAKREKGKMYRPEIITSTPVYVDGIKMKKVKKKLHRDSAFLIKTDTIPLNIKVIKL